MSEETIANLHVGWIGTGRMGFAMAERLLNAGVNVSVWNRTRGKAEPLAEKGAKIVDSVVELSDCDIVFTMVAGPDDFIEVTNSGGSAGYNLALNPINAGNVGIGVLQPSHQLHIESHGSNTYATMKLEGQNRGGQIDMYQGSTITNQILGDQSGNLYIGSSGGFGQVALDSQLLLNSYNKAFSIKNSTFLTQLADDAQRSIVANGQGIIIVTSYNFGLTTFGVGQMNLNPSGKVTDKVNSIEWEPIKSEGNFYFGVMRYKIGFLEALIGYRRGTYKFSEFKHTSSESTLSTPLEGSVGLITIGIGVEF